MAEPYYSDSHVEIWHGDCREVLPSLEPVETCITDPPYGLSFMGKAWDHAVPDETYWSPVRDAVKPGGMLLAFGGTRLWHWLAVGIEQAGWEIRDTLMWLYGSGFPKSLDISKAIDKGAGAEREPGRTLITDGTRGSTPNAPAAATCGDCGKPRWGADYCRCQRDGGPATDAAKTWDGWGTAMKPAWENILVAQSPGTTETEAGIIVENLIRLEAQLCLLLSDATIARLSSPSSLSVPKLLGIARWTADDRTSTRDALRGQTDTSRFESATLTSLNTVRSWRTILADLWKRGNTSTIRTGSRTTTDWPTLRSCLSEITPASIIPAEIRGHGSMLRASTAVAYFHAAVVSIASTHTLSVLGGATAKGRTSRLVGADLGLAPNWEPIILAMNPLDGTFAANALEHGVAGLNVDGARIGTEGGTRGSNYPKTGLLGIGGNATIEQIDAGRWPANLVLDEEAAQLLDEQSGERPGGGSIRNGRGMGYHGGEAVREREPMGDFGGASRFFYTSKASRSDRGRDNDHPTVKPSDLMKWLCTLTATPTGGTILDPFMGSGTTLYAAKETGRKAIGIELDEKWCEIAAQRCSQGVLAL